MWGGRLASLLKVPRQLSGSSRHRSPWLPRDRRTVLAAAARWHHTAPESLKCAWQLHGDHLELRYANTLMRFDFVWLRDHCRSASCYNAKTNQRSLDTASVDLGIKPKAVRVDETTLFLTWPDGHVTRYGLEWLVKNSYEGQKQQVMHPRILWNAEIYRQAQVPSVDCRSFLETDEGLKEFLQNFLLYGIAFVENVTPTKEDTEILAERISLIRCSPLIPVYCAAWPGLHTKGLGLLQSLASPLKWRRSIALWDLTSFSGRAWSRWVMEPPREHRMTFVIVGLRTERSGWRKQPVWEEQSFARRDTSCYDLEGADVWCGKICICGGEARLVAIDLLGRKERN
ncbi:trimethyllysine dioxygenase, mitochondrial isoform 4-T4 [Theristicus caerulescens]